MMMILRAGELQNHSIEYKRETIHSAESLSCDQGHQWNLEFDVTIFLPRNRWATLYFERSHFSEGTWFRWLNMPVSRCTVLA